MKTLAYKIIPEPSTGKTRLEYRFNREELEKLREVFSEVESTEIYPSFDKKYNYALNFYNTDDYFLKKLDSYCRRKLTAPVGFKVYSEFIWRIGLYLLLFLFVLYLILNFLQPLLVWLITALDLFESKSFSAAAGVVCSF
ncbi:MAG: hypothetical protein ACLFN5_02530 [bacterium]